MKNIINSILSIILVCTSVTAQKYSRIEDPAILEEQKEVLQQTYPQLFDDATIKDVLIVGDKHSIVQHVKDGVYYETIINSDRKDMLLLETAELITPSDIPDVVKDAFTESEFGDEKIVNQFRVKRPEGDELYRIDIIKSGQEFVTSFYYDNLGHIAKPAM